MLYVETFVSTQKELLVLEQNEETDQNKELLHKQSAKELEKQGLCLTKLFPTSVSTGLYGRSVVKFTRERLPNNSFSSGDIAGVTHKDLAIICEGIVSKVGKDSLCVAFEELTEDVLNLSKVCLLKLTNTVTYKRYLSCLKQVEKCDNVLIEKLLTDDIILPQTSQFKNEIKYFNENLNHGQRDAVELCLTRPDIAVVHGPPGTGKTTTIVEVVRQHVLRGEKVLVCAPSNIAVDNLLTKLAASNRVVRLGHPARINVNLQHLCLDAKLKALDADNILGDVRKDIDNALSQRFGGKKPVIGGGGYHSNRGIGELKKELRERELKLTQEVLSSAEVVLCTLTSAGKQGPLGKLAHDHFNVCVVDEASQALEIACWMGILNTKKVILAGDHLQLPPTIKSDKAAKGGLEVTMMERLFKSLRSSRSGFSVTLTEQYRMNERIMKWSSDEMYEGSLTAHPSVAGHVLREMSGVESTEVTSHPICFVDTAGSGSYECLVGVSRGNVGEAKLVVEYLTELKTAGLEDMHMSVITPYNLQIELIRTEMGGRFKEVEVCTVDGFQGREKEAIVISMVRSNESGEIGFLSESRRMNVAVTRARRHVCLVGDSLTVKRNDFLSRLVAYFTANGLVKSAFEYGLDLGSDDTVIKNVAYPVDNFLPDSEHVIQTTKESASQKPTFKESCTVTLSNLKCSDSVEPIAFPGLNSYQRRIVHALCEDMELFSSSSGTGSLRVLKVSKTESNDDAIKNPAENSKCEKVSSVEKTSIEERSLENGQQSQQKASPSLRVCQQCGGRIPSSNMELHLLRCTPKTFSLPEDRTSKVNTKTSKVNAKTSKVNSKTSKVNTKSSGQISATSGPSQNTAILGPGEEDVVLAQAASERLWCPLSGCAGKVQSYISPCRFCTTCFCTEHQLPEVHGCSDAARRDAQLHKPSTSMRQHAQNKDRIQQALKAKGKERTKKNK